MAAPKVNMSLYDQSILYSLEDADYIEVCSLLNDGYTLYDALEELGLL